MNWCFSFIALIIFQLHTFAQIEYPHTRKIQQADDYHGTRIEDPYRWLENDTSEATHNWVLDQSNLTEAYLEGIPHRHEIRKKIAEYYNYERFSSPVRRGEFYYFFKNDGLQDYAVLYRQHGMDGKPEVILNPNILWADGSYQLTDFQISKNGRYGAYLLSASGSDWQTIRIKDLSTFQDLEDTIKWVKFSDVAWKGDGFYYSRYPEPENGTELSSQNQDHQLWYHRVGTKQSDDKLVYRDTANPFRFYFASTSEDERYVFLSIVDRAQKGVNGNALWYLDTEDGNNNFKPIVAEPGEFIYGVIDPVPGNKLLIQTNDNAPKGRLILFDPLNPTKEKWKTIIPEKEIVLEMATMGGGQLFLKYLQDAAAKLFVYSLKGKFKREIRLPGPGDADMHPGLKDDSVVFYTYRSLNYPTQLFQYHVNNGQSTVFRKPEILFNPEDYITTLRFCTSRDGTRVPMYMVHKKELKRDGKNPTILYGYGGFNYSPGLSFNNSVMPWLEQGGIYAIVHLRGGGEYGEEWHKAGMLHRKQRVFDDFIAAAEYMINRKYTSPSKLAVRGASNGGLLVGAVINQRPELFKVAVPEMGVMDMLRFQNFTIGWNWISEYGTSENENDFRNLFAYSPLHNIKQDAEYPATLVVTADHDDRVVPAHSFKYLATMQAKVSKKNPVLLKIETNTGHGLTSIVKNIDLAADIYSFILYNMGIQWKFVENQTSDK